MNIDDLARIRQAEPRLRPFVLPQGTIEIQGNVPPRDLVMLSTQTHLIVRESVHPAMQRLLFKVAKQIHDAPSFLQSQGEFPLVAGADFPVSSVTASGSLPWLEEVLPYRWAQLADLLLLGILPVLLLAILAVLWITRWFDWRVNGALEELYGEVCFLERSVQSLAQGRDAELRQAMEQLDTLDVKLARLHIPPSHARRWYSLRKHLHHVRERAMVIATALHQNKSLIASS
jgi:hypothetical protein